MVSAFETRMGLVLAQERVSRKSNEIKAIPELLDALYLKGFLVRETLKNSQAKRAVT